LLPNRKIRYSEFCILLFQIAPESGFFCLQTVYTDKNAIFPSAKLKYIAKTFSSKLQTKISDFQSSNPVSSLKSSFKRLKSVSQLKICFQDQFKKIFSSSKRFLIYNH